MQNKSFRVHLVGEVIFFRRIKTKVCSMCALLLCVCGKLSCTCLLPNVQGKAFPCVGRNLPRAWVGLIRSPLAHLAWVVGRLCGREALTLLWIGPQLGLSSSKQASKFTSFFLGLKSFCLNKFSPLFKIISIRKIFRDVVTFLFGLFHFR